MIMENICPITHETLRDGKDKFGMPYKISLECGHTFDSEALYVWFKSSKTRRCPMCRGPPVVIWK